MIMIKYYGETKLVASIGLKKQGERDATRRK